MTQNLMQGSDKNHCKHYFKHHETVFFLLNRVSGALHPRREIHRNFVYTNETAHQGSTARAQPDRDLLPLALKCLHHHELFSVGCLHPCYSQTSVSPSEILQKKQCSVV